MAAMGSSQNGRLGLLLAGKMLVFVVAFLAVPAAWAGNRDMEHAAQAACLSGDYAKGVGILAELYVSTRDAAYIFNQGRCFEQNGKYEEAILRFREFQRKNANAGRAPDPLAEQHIADCQALMEKPKPVPTTAPVPVVAEPATPATAAASSPPVSETRVAPAAPPVSPSAESERPAAPPAALGTVPLPAGSSAATGQARQVDLTQPSPPSQAQPEGSIFGRWWFWTAVGVAVAGGITAGLLLTRGGGSQSFCPECDYSNGVNLQ